MQKHFKPLKTLKCKRLERIITVREAAAGRCFNSTKASINIELAQGYKDLYSLWFCLCRYCGRCHCRQRQRRRHQHPFYLLILMLLFTFTLSGNVLFKNFCLVGQCWKREAWSFNRKIFRLIVMMEKKRHNPPHTTKPALSPRPPLNSLAFILYVFWLHYWCR